MTANPTTISDAVVEARNIQEAILCIARGLDDVLARLDAPADPRIDTWASEWDNSELHKQVPRQYDAHIEDQREKEIEAVREQLRTAVGEDAEALQARLRLLKDTAANHIETIPEGERYGVEGETVDLVPPSEGRKVERRQWAYDHELHTFLPLFENDPRGAADAFAAGGAEWLYLGNREAIMQMPYEWRTFLVEDVAVDSQKAALEMSADIMKHRSSADKQVSIDNIQGISDARG